MQIAFYDLDKTLLSINSAKLWGEVLWRNGKISSWQALAAGFWLTRYHLGWAHRGWLKHFQNVFIAFKGVSEQSFKQFLTKQFHSKIVHTIQPGALRTLEANKKIGALNVMITSSPNILAELIGKHLKMDAVIATVLEVDSRGVFTGRAQGKICYGKAKLELATHFAKNNNAQLKDALFYTDSVTDLSLLEAVGCPVAVNPDMRLRKFARKSNWQVVDWK